MPIQGHDVDEDSSIRLCNDNFFRHEASNTSKIVASVDPSTLAAGTALTLTSNAGRKLRFARLITYTLDGVGAALVSVTFVMVGHRFGRPVTETITVTNVDGTAITTTGTKVVDQVTSVTMTAKTLSAAGDAIFVGIDGTKIGLTRPIDAVNDVLGIFLVATNTEGNSIAISSTTVDVANSAIISGTTIAAADALHVQYLRSKSDADRCGNAGVYA